MSVLTDRQRRDRRDAERRVLVQLPLSEHTAETRDEIAARIFLSPDRTAKLLNRLIGQGKVRRIRAVNPDNRPGPRRVKYWLAAGLDYTTRAEAAMTDFGGGH